MKAIKAQAKRMENVRSIGKSERGGNYLGLPAHIHIIGTGWIYLRLS